MHDDIREPADEQPAIEEPPVVEVPAEQPPNDAPPIDIPPVEEPPPTEPAARPAAVTDEVAAISDSLSGDTGALDVASVQETAVMPPLGPPVADVAAATAPETPPVPAVQTAPDAQVPEGVDMGPEARSNTWVWVGLIVGVLIAGAALGYAWWYTTNRSIPIPNVVGKLPPQAVQTLNDADLRLGTVSEVPTESVPPGTIVEQKPRPFTTLKPGGTVDLVVATSPKGARVPAVTGRSFLEASTLLGESRLAPYRVDSFSTTAAADFVITQIPALGAHLDPGAFVILVVSKGQRPAQVRAPRLAGLTQEEASVLLKALGLRAAVARSYDASVAAGEIITQTPLPTSQLPYDSTIQYLVSQGPGSRTVTVPSVATLGRKAAEKLLKDRGLKARIVRVSSASVATNRVVSQMPIPGMKASRGATVDLLVSRGDIANAATPELASRQESDAVAMVKQAGFTPVFVGIKTSAYPPGVVFGQYPEANTLWPAGSLVVAAIAREQ